MTAGLSRNDPHSLQQHLDEVSEIHHSIFEDIHQIQHHKSVISHSDSHPKSEWMTKKPGAKWQKNKMEEKTHLKGNRTITHLKEQIKKLSEEYKYVKKESINIEKREDARHLIKFLKENKKTIERLTSEIQDLGEEILADSLKDLKKSDSAIGDALKRLELRVTASSSPQDKIIPLMTEHPKHFHPQQNEILKASWKIQKDYLRSGAQQLWKIAAKMKEVPKTKDKLRLRMFMQNAGKILNARLNNLYKLSLNSPEEVNDRPSEDQTNLEKSIEEFHECLGMLKEPIVYANLRYLEENYGELIGYFEHRLQHFEKKSPFTVGNVENESERDSKDGDKQK